MEWEYFSGLSDFELDEEEIEAAATQKGRKNIRHIKDFEDLSIETKIANRNEKERLSRLERYKKKLEEAVSGHDGKNELILDYDFENEMPLVAVHKALVQKLKHHQKEGVKFMWYACFESLQQSVQSEGSGCIIAHCMGLGKTFQVVTLVHTLLSHPQVGVKNILICCPKNTLMNWVNEFQMWIAPDLGRINVYNPTRFDSNSDRFTEIALWRTNGGVCMINYELMRILLEDDNKDRLKFHEHLCNPGPDLVVCDEGHVLKNEETKLSKVMSRIRTMRRVVLTGTPMQNNLREYHCMIQFVKPNLLGTRKEFLNMFVNPILNGQYENSREEDVQLMKERSHILHKKLSGSVQRFDLSTLKTYLPKKHEYVISVALTESQIRMYKFYLANYSAKGDPEWKNDGVALFADYQSLQRIWTHPYTLKMYAEKHEKEAKKKSKKKKKKSYEDSDSSDSETYRRTRFPLMWWLRFVPCEYLDDARQSNKLRLLLHIINECENSGDKLLVFSGSLYSLQLIQHFLDRISNSSCDNPALCNLTSNWEEHQDYVLLTGGTSAEDRHSFCKAFNDPDNTRLRLFLISTKAGGMGINLTAANRAVIFDVSWNPSHDIQSIFRIYRIGQRRPCFVYRFVAAGTMEEKIYERQVAKESISQRVVDEKQIARHYTERELLELYQFEEKTVENGEVKGEGDVEDEMLRRLLGEVPGSVWGVHEHDSLLEHRKEEELQELEKNDAWSAYDNVDDLENLHPDVRQMLSVLTPDSFNPSYLRRVLERKYPEATDEDLSAAMEDLMPKVKDLLSRHDFVDVMKRQALYLHKPCKSSKGRKRRRKTVEVDRKVEEMTNKTVDLTESPIRGTEWSCRRNGRGYSSESDDSLFLYDITPGKKKMKRTRKPLKVWGVRGGKRYGSPDEDSS